jgi:hypothetical protein
MPNMIECLHPSRRGHVAPGFTGIALAVFVGMLSLLIVSDPVLGQNASGESVRKRPRLDYESFGLSFRALLGDKERSGPRKPADQLNVFTRVDVGAGYRSNVLRTPNAEKASAFTNVAPRLAIWTDWDKHSINLVMKADASVFASEPGENKVDLVGRLEGRFDLENDSGLKVEVEAARLQAARGSSNDVGPTFEPQVINRYTIGTGFGRGKDDDIKFAANAQIIRFDYQQVDALSRDDQDSIDFNIASALAISSDGPLRIFFVPRVLLTKYDEAVNSDSIVYDFAMGWNFDPSILTAGTGRIGITHRDFERSGDPDITSLLLENKLLWNATPLISMRSDAFVQTDDSQNEVGTGKIVAGIDFNVDYELFDNLVLTSGIGYQNDQFQGLERTDEILRYSLAAMYLIGEHYFIRGDLGFESRTSDNRAEEYNDATIFIRFGLKNCCLSDAGLINAFGEGVLDVFR